MSGTPRNIPYWLDTAPRGPLRDSESLSATADVAIVGGGLSGLSAALTLARAGSKVVLLEKDVVGWGASGRNGGICAPGLRGGIRRAIRRYGADVAARMFRTYVKAVDYVEELIETEKIDCSWERTGKLNLASKSAHYEGFKATKEALQSVTGQVTELVPKERLRDEIGTDVYHGALIDPMGAGLHVGKLVHGLAGAAEDAGAELHEHAEVTRLDRRPTGFVIKTPQGDMTAKNVVIATNGYTGGVVPWLRRRIVPVGSFIIVTERLSQSVCDDVMPTNRMASDTLNLAHYFRLTADNRMLFGGRARFAMTSQSSDMKSGAILLTDMRRVFPQLEDAEIEYTWGGLVAFALDQLPHAGEIDGLFYSLGYAGRGVQMSTYMGRQTANAILGRPTDNAWGANPFRAVPGHFGPPWFLPFAGAYYKVKDRLV